MPAVGTCLLVMTVNPSRRCGHGFCIICSVPIILKNVDKIRKRQIYHSTWFSPFPKCF